MIRTSIASICIAVLATLVVTVGPASAQGYACANEPGLSAIDPSPDGVLTIAELQQIAAQFPDNLALQNAVANAASGGYAGVQYDGNCGPVADGSTADDGGAVTGSTDDGNGAGDGSTDTDAAGGESESYGVVAGAESPADGGYASTVGGSPASLPTAGVGAAVSESIGVALLSVVAVLLLIAGSIVRRTDAGLA